VFDVKKGKASKAMRGSKKHYYSTPQKQRELWRWSLALATTNSQHAKAEPTGAHRSKAIEGGNPESQSLAGMSGVRTEHADVFMAADEHWQKLCSKRS
jgi:hypothetical protein